MAGHLIVFEGPEGGGKSLQARRLAGALRQVGHEVVLTREPGGTPIGEDIRALLLRADGYDMLPEVEALLMTAARAQHVADVVAPALAAGAIVVCDRFVDSTLAYQGGGRGLARGALDALQRFAVGDTVPDLRILLDLPVEVGLARRHAEQGSVNRIDAASLAFHERVRQTFLGLAAEDPAGWVVIDARLPVAAVAHAVNQAVASILPPPGRERTIVTGAAAPLSRVP